MDYDIISIVVKPASSPRNGRVYARTPRRTVRGDIRIVKSDPYIRIHPRRVCIIHGGRVEGHRYFGTFSEGMTARVGVMEYGLRRRGRNDEQRAASRGCLGPGGVMVIDQARLSTWNTRHTEARGPFTHIHICIPFGVHIHTHLYIYTHARDIILFSSRQYIYIYYPRGTGAPGANQLKQKLNNCFGSLLKEIDGAFGI